MVVFMFPPAALGLGRLGFFFQAPSLFSNSASRKRDFHCLGIVSEVVSQEMRLIHLDVDGYRWMLA